jgi:hypothetical protein
MKNRTIFVIIQIAVCLTYGVFRASELQDFRIQTILIESLIMPLLAFIVTFFVEGIKLATLRASYEWKKSFNTFNVILVIIFSIIGSLMILKLIATRNKQDVSDTRTFKKEVIDSNDNYTKQVGDHKNELLNDNNLYENFKYNFALKFPKDFVVDYGIGKDVIVQATNDYMGYAIAVSIAPTETENLMNKNESKELVSDKVVDEMFEYYNDPSYLNQFIGSLEDRALSDVKVKKTTVTNYNNRKYIHVECDAYAILDNELHPLVLDAYITFYNHHIYQLFFRSWLTQNNDAWRATIKKTMSLTTINEKVRDYR